MGVGELTYAEFINGKTQFGCDSGFAPVFMPDAAFEFQQALIDWSVRKGRAAIFADCGLGKTLIQLAWAENIIRHTNGRVLILTPIAVGKQTCREAEKFGMHAERSHDGKLNDARIVVANYERLHYFSPDDFDGVVCDESSILKNFKGKRKAEITEFMRTRKYRLLCTATAAPNDYIELGTSSECIGEMGFQDMIAMFFKQETSKDRLGWGRTKYRLRSHAENDFWRWIVSWARACRLPSDLGFSDEGFNLPNLDTHEHVVVARKQKPGTLFSTPAIHLDEQREERRRTIEERCEMVARLADHDRPVVAWCHLNDEGDRLSQMIPDAVQVSGSDSDERKEDVFEAFSAGDIRVLITKPTIAGFGLNWQHCSHETFFPSHSFEQFYQAVRRCWRFGQQSDVRVDVITSEGEEGVLKNMNTKAEKAARMFANLVSLMNDHLTLTTSTEFSETEEVPQWVA